MPPFDGAARFAHRWGMRRRSPLPVPLVAAIVAAMLLVAQRGWAQAACPTPRPVDACTCCTDHGDDAPLPDAAAIAARCCAIDAPHAPLPASPQIEATVTVVPHLAPPPVSECARVPRIVRAPLSVRAVEPRAVGPPLWLSTCVLRR